MVWKFRDWTIETNVTQELTAIIDKEETSFILLDEDKDLFLLIQLSDYGEGFAIDKIGWNAQIHIFPNEKVIFLATKEEEEE